MKKIISIFLTVILILSTLSVSASAAVGDKSFDENESNNDISSANIIYNDYTVFGELPGQYDIDCFKFTLSSRSNILFLCQADKSGVMVALYDYSGDIITVAEGYYSDGYYYDTLSETLSAGTYYVKLLQDSGYTNSRYLFYFEYETAAHSHSYSSKVTKPTCTAGGYTTYTCSCGDSYKGNYTSATGHNYTESVKKATCTTTGLKTFTCSCGDKYTETIPATNHANATTDPGKEPTTTEVGYTAGKYCPDCKIWIEGHREIPKVEAHKHSYTSSVTKNPTCTLAGENTFTCSCGDKYTEAIPATNHANATTDPGKEPTTTEVGYTAGKYCPDCKIWIEGHNEIPKVEAHKHSYTSSVTKNPTCTTTGLKTFICSCGDKYTETIPATNHANATTDPGKEPTTTEVGYTAGKYCPDCKIWIEGHVEIPKLEEDTHTHTYTATITTEPTCWRDGVLTYTCECGDSYTEDIEKSDHDYNEWWVKTKPTCTKAGLEWTYCRNCDLDFEREIPATGHEIIEYVMKASTDEHAAYGGDGAYTTACDICNEVFEQIFFARPAEYILSTSECTYNGKVRKPSVTVKDADGKKLVKGTDYDVIYPDGMKLPGKYDIEIFFKGNYLGGKHLTFTILPKATTGGKAKTQSTDSITLTWSKTTGATGYRVYQYSSSKGAYVVKASVKGTTTYKVTGLKAGTTYKFKIKPYVKADDGTVIWGKASSVFETCTKPAKPTIKSLTTSSSKATLTWNNISGETGYQVYYATSKNSTYKKLKNVSADSVKYTASKLTSGKTYYFKVRAYKKVDGNTVYGDFSAVKSVKIK